MILIVDRLARFRPFREWLLIHRLHHQGLPVPVPIAARYVRQGATYRGDLITERIDGAESLAEEDGEEEVAERHAMLRRRNPRHRWHRSPDLHKDLPLAADLILPRRERADAPPRGLSARDAAYCPWAWWPSFNG